MTLLIKMNEHASSSFNQGQQNELLDVVPWYLNFAFTKICEMRLYRTILTIKCRKIWYCIPQTTNKNKLIFSLLKREQYSKYNFKLEWTEIWSPPSQTAFLSRNAAQERIHCWKHFSKPASPSSYKTEKITWRIIHLRYVNYMPEQSINSVQSHLHNMGHG